VHEKGLSPLLYTSSNQYAPTYYALNHLLIHEPKPPIGKGKEEHRSGIVHHMPIHTAIMQEIFELGEKKHLGEKSVTNQLASPVH
jgi:hypothetical protein